MMRMIFSTVRAPHEPAFTVESLAITHTGRPATVADPVTTPSAGRSPAETFAKTPSSTNEPSSTRRRTRSRANSLPFAALASWYLTGPPSCTSERSSGTGGCPGGCDDTLRTLTAELGLPRDCLAGLRRHGQRRHRRCVHDGAGHRQREQRTQHRLEAGRGQADRVGIDLDQPAAVGTRDPSSEQAAVTGADQHGLLGRVVALTAELDPERTGLADGGGAG